MSALHVVPEPAPKARRGTTNGNARGSAEDRRRRREWLVDTYRANVDVAIRPWDIDEETGEFLGFTLVELGEGIPACRCYRCGELLTVATVTADRIKPGIEGGTYARSNIRPACGHCNSSTGQALAIARKKRTKR